MYSHLQFVKIKIKIHEMRALLDMYVPDVFVQFRRKILGAFINYNGYAMISDGRVHNYSYVHNDLAVGAQFVLLITLNSVLKIQYLGRKEQGQPQ